MQHHDSPVLRKGCGVGLWGPQNTIFLQPWHSSVSDSNFYWHESESMWVICIINETTLYHSASAHFIIARESKDNFCFLSGFLKMISHWWLICPHQNCMRLWRRSFHCQQPRQECGCQAPRLLKWFTTSKCYIWQQI